MSFSTGRVHFTSGRPLLSRKRLPYIHPTQDFCHNQGFSILLKVVSTINSLHITGRVAPGDVIIPDLVGSGAALIATGYMSLRRWS